MTTLASTKRYSGSPGSWNTLLRNAAAILLVAGLIFGIGYSIYSTRSGDSHTADFSVAASPPISNGSGMSSTVLVRSLDGFNGQVSLRAMSPNGISCKGVPGSSNAAVIFVPGSWTLQCKAETAGDYTVSISATAGSVSQNTSVIFRFGDHYRPTSVAFTCNPPMIIVNETSTCQVSVTDTGTGATILTNGVVNLETANNPNIVLSSCSLVHGSCTLNYTGSNIGNIQLLANYTGDGIHRSKQASSVVIVRPTGTVTNLNCTPGIITLESGPTTCNVTVGNGNQDQIQTVATGTVVFAKVTGGTINPLTCALTNGSCSVQYLPSNGIGTFILTANYTGDGTHAPSLGQFTISVSLAPTTTTMNCSPSTIIGNGTSNCIVTVTDTALTPSGPNGFVQEQCSTQCTTNPVTMCALMANGPNSSTCSFTVKSATSTPIMSVMANYQGDTVHAVSSGNFALSFTTMPQTVSVSGHVTTTSQCFHCKAVRLDFVNRNTGLVYSATVNDSTYRINLANMQSYNVIMYWNGVLGTSGSCTGAVLDLHQTTDKLTVDYQC